jgi:hypothetical protein
MGTKEAPLFFISDYHSLVMAWYHISRHNLKLSFGQICQLSPKDTNKLMLQLFRRQLGMRPNQLYSFLVRIFLHSPHTLDGLRHNPIQMEISRRRRQEKWLKETRRKLNEVLYYIHSIP